VGQERVLYAEAFFQPYLETSLRALPYHYRNYRASEGTVIKFVIRGERDYIVFLYSEGSHWRLLSTCNGAPVSVVTIAQEVIWRIFTKGISPEEAKEYAHITGQQEAGLKILDMLAVMA
jgi:hypothetical protein